MIAVSLTLLVITPLLSGAIKAQGQLVSMDSKENLEGTMWYSPDSTSRTSVHKRNIPRQGRNYEDDTIPAAQENVDLHKGEFCVDVSTYGEIEYDHVPKEVCDTTFSKQCEEKSDKVCDDVTEIVCEIVPYTECEMTMENVPYRSFEVIEKNFKKKVCTAGMDIVKHTKMMPECRNVTKQNCITKWETDADGKQVWAGNEACEPVTWRECKLVPKQVDFKVPKITCEEGKDVHYDYYIDATKEQMISNMVCEVKHANSCAPKVSKKCADIKYQECTEVPNEQCEEKDIKVPKQEKEHKKKCLLADDDSLPPTPAPSYPSPPAPTPAPSYPSPSPSYPTPAVQTNVLSQPAPAPVYTNNVGAAPQAPPPSSSYGVPSVPRGGRFNSQTFTRQPINSQSSRRPKVTSTFRQQPPRFIQNPRSQGQFIRGQFQG